MYKTFTLPLKSAIFSLSALFILTACGGFTIDLNLPANSDCLANPFESECDNDKGIAEYRKFIIDDCANNPEKANTVLCTAAEATTNPPSDDENIAGGGAEDVVKEVAGNTPKDIKIKPELNKNSFTKTDKEKGETTTLEIVDLCTNSATADDKQCTPAVIDCINNPFSGSCQGDNVLGNFVRDDVTVSKAVVLQDKRAEDCRTGSIDRALCQNLNVQKQRCAGAAFSTDKICTSVAYSVCKADAFDPLCGEKENFQGVYFSERSNVCFEDPNNPHCKGASGHIAVVCSEYPFDRLCTGNADYDDARANACESDPSVSASCPVVELVESEEEGTELEVAVDVCLDNPFGPTCADSDYNNARKDLAKTCAIQAVTGAVTSACKTIIAAAGPCFKNPFDTDCDSNPAVRTYIAQLRSSRVALCKNSTGLFDHLIAPLCTGAPVAKSVCRIDPFNTACIGDRDFAGDRLSACRDGSSNQQCGGIIAGVCGDNPFDTLCGGGYTGDRLSACRNGSTNTQCGDIIAGVCGDNPFDALCGNGYTGDRLSACRNGSTNTQCGDIIAGVCGDNPFDALCGNGYTGDRLSACRDGSASAGQCGNIIAGVCRDNPFDSLCGNGYTNARLSACRDGIVGTGQCGDIIAGVCGDDPFDALCGNGYTGDRLSACRNGSTNTQCGDIIAGVCGDNPFDALCGNGYTGERETACRNGSTNTQCGNIITGVCGDNPFDALCGGGYTGDRLSACRNGSTNTQCGNIIAGVCGDDPFDALCGNGYTNARLSACRDGTANAGQCGNIVAGVCSGNPFDPLCGNGYTQSRRDACSGNPFAPRCAGDVYNDLRVTFCENNAGNHPECPAPEPTTPQVTAKVWADSFDEPLATEASSDERGGRFLIGRETDLDASRVRNAGRRNPYYLNNLNLADATFNGVALGGDRADGVAFASNVRAIYNNVLSTYAGVLSGTNLGAPLTDTEGSAKWIGSFQIRVGPSGGRAVEDFVLNISFGAGDGAGEIEALIQNDLHYPSDHHITGEFDDAGVITGTVQHGYYRTNDADNRGRAWRTGKLTGLIGEEGAVGAFVMSNYYGGFVARPSSADELRTLEQTCGDDPYNPLCTIGYESERLALIEHCITDDNVNDERCVSVNKLTHCIKNPFRSDCEESLPQHHELALANRIAFCRKAENVDDALCTYSYAIQYICTRHPFSPQCFADSRYNQTRERACTTAGTGSTECRTLAGINCGSNPFHSYCDSGYNDARASACNANPGQQRCRNTVERVCNGNPFDTLCRNTTVYLNARKTHCRSTWNDSRCPATIRAVCGVDPFDRMCNSVYDRPRETACRAGSTNTQCGGIISSICGGNPFDPLCGSGYTQIRRNACSDNPFATRCAGDAYNDLRVSFCEDNAGTHPSCPAPTPQVTAEVWADSFDEDLAHGATAEDTESQFLIGRETDLDTGGRGSVRPNDSYYNDGLNLADATFNGTALRGDAADGVAFFAAERANNGGLYSYAGILSGTNLGAPLTNTIGSAKWIGSFKLERGNPTDFVLNVSFGTGTGAGEIEALIQRYIDFDDYHLKGEFDDAGVITGKVGRGHFRDRTDDPNDRGITGYSSKLTGLIGEEGAVGAFLINNHFGGFVARPSSTDELRTLAQTCADDPFNSLCSVGYESERSARIEHCIIGNNSRNTALCGGLKRFNYCINNPFHTECESLLSQYYEQARANRITFCRTAGNADNGLCTVAGAFAHICRSHPFDAQCLGNNVYRLLRRDACSSDPFATRCTGDVYNDLRVTFCENNADNPACPQTPQVTAKVWADSFDEDLAHAPTAEDTESKFLIGRETDLDTGGVSSARPYEPDYNKGLNLADATFNGVALGGDAADGVAFFAAGRSSNGHYSTHSYAGILSGTNLGAPLTDTQGSAKWIGSLRYEDADPTDFVLNISFGTGDGAGEVEALVLGYYSLLYGYGIYRLDGYGDYHLKGEFDDAGVITGTARRGFYRRNDPDNRGQHDHATGKLTGLIGEEGAVGAFIIDSYFGGFVARPSSADELQTVAQTCASDPFNSLCDIGYESERNAMIEHCIIDDNYLNRTRCKFAHTSRACIKNPFQIDCDARLPQYYEQARANRVAFCRTVGNAGNVLCTVDATFAHICTNHPFDAQCRGDNSYRPIRRNACSGDPFAPRCAGEGYNDLRVSFCEDNAGTHPSCPQPTPNRVTTADWLASFDTPLATQSPIRLQNNGYRNWNQFLKSTASGLDTSGLEVLHLTSTSFANATFDGQSLGGDATGGVYSLRTHLNGLINNFSSIHLDTDLGAPITQAAGTKLIWHGVFQTAKRNYGGNGRGYDTHTQDFALEINFGAGSKVGTVEAFVKKNRSSYDDTYLLLKGEFDANGVIDGTVKGGFFQDHDRNRIVDNGYVSSASGVLSGLIGEKGAVGVFQGQTGSGGFVATPNARFNPNVRHSDWVNSFDLGDLKNHASKNNEGNPAVFVRGDETGIHSPLNSLSGVRFAPTFLENTLDFSDINANLDSTDKVSYIATAESFGRGNRFSGRLGHAAGIWPTTDLGLPLEIRPADAHGNPHKAIWGGKLGLIVNAQLLDNRGAGSGLIPTRDIGLVVDYTNQTIHNTSTINGAHQVVLNGRWTNNADNSQNGVINGDITYNAAPADTDSTAYAGVVKGIIGQEGAVGAFVRDGTDFDYVGGFIAHPSAVFVPTTPQVTAEVWADSFDEDLDTTVSANDTESKFLIGRATDLDNGGVRPYSADPDYNGDLNLATATFNGSYLGGYGTNGVAYFTSGEGGYYSYAGILSGTNLGAPLTDTAGSAKWVGSFLYLGFFAGDFVLNLSFGTGEGAGELEAILQTRLHFDIHIAGEFDDTGVITGTARSGFFSPNDPDNRGSYIRTEGELTGLIGEKGAVGAFLLDKNFGVFVARSSSAAERRTLRQTCADDPFHGHCTIGYESERNAILEHCIIGGNANDESCDSVKLYRCISEPFYNWCDSIVPDHYEQLRENRVAFCRTVGNADNALCTVDTTIAHICTNYPFDAQCRGDNDYRPIRRDACLGNPFATRCTGDVYNDLRVSFCENNAGNPSCPRPVVPPAPVAPTPAPDTTPNRVTTEDWVANFETAPATVADVNRNHFLQNPHGLPSTGINSNSRIDTSSNSFTNISIYSLRLDDDIFQDGGGDAADGMVFYKAHNGDDADSYFYAGILNDTDLGAPLTQTSGTATWSGRFRAVLSGSILREFSRDFTLDITFNATGGDISTVVSGRTEDYFELDGTFTRQGVISGTANHVYYENGRIGDVTGDIVNSGPVTGLIGQEGAVGAFISNRQTNNTGGFAGGFVARPPSE